MDRIKDHPQISHNAEKMIGEFPTKECKFSIFNRDNTLDLVGKDIQVFRGLLLEDNTIEYIPQGIFHVNPDDIKTNSTAKTIELTIKDKSIDFDCPYGGIGKISYPCTLGQFINEIVTRHNFILETPNFPFSDLILNERPNFDLNTATERSLIAKAGDLGGCTTQMSRTGGVRISKPYLTGITIKKIDYKKLPSKEKQFGPINQVSLSRSNVDNDDILSKDNVSISQNGLCEWKIFDNPYVDLIRETIIDQVASNLFGMTIIPFELEDTIDSYLYDINDSVSVIDKMNNIFNTTILSISSSSRIFTKLKASVQTKIEANVKLAGSSKEILNQVKLDVDHNKQRITALASEVTENTEKTNKLEMTVDETKQTISKVETTVEDITKTTQTSEGGNHLYLEKALEQDALEYHIKGKSEQETSDNSPSPEYPSEINSIKGIRNLFNISTATKGVLNNTNGTLIYSSDVSIFEKTENSINFSSINPWRGIVSDFIFANSDNYTLSFNSTSTSLVQSLFFYDENKNFISRENFKVSQNRTYSIPNNVKYVRLIIEGNADYVANTEVSVSNIQFEEGTIAHPYVPHGSWGKVKITGKNLLDAPYNEDNKLTRTATKNDDYKSTDFYTYLEAGKNYTFSCKTSGTFGHINQTECYLLFDKKYDYFIQMDSKNGFTFIPNKSGKYYLRTDVNVKDETHSFWDFQIEEGKEATPYDEFKEKEVLIDLNKENLFDYNYFYENYEITGDIQYIFLKMIPNTLYTLNTDIFNYNSSYAAVFINSGQNWSFETSTNGVMPNTSRTITSDNNGYITIGIRNRVTVEDFKNDITHITLYKGYEPYYELSSLSDETSNNLNIVDGQVVFNEKIGKVVLDGSENWLYQKRGDNLYRFSILINDLPSSSTRTKVISTHFQFKGIEEVRGNIFHYEKYLYIYSDLTSTADFKAFLKNQYNSGNPLIVYYELAEPRQIILPSVQIPLFEGTNHISLVEDIETETSIKYLRETPLSDSYALNKDLDKTNSNLSNTNHQLGQAQSDINATNTHLNNDFYDKNQIDSMQTSTEQLITQIKNQVEMTTNSTNLQISVLQEKLINGITSVVTETGYRFDKDGLSISKTGEPMKSVLDNEGLIVYRDTTIKLKVSGDEVYTDNLIVNTYLIQRPIRREQGVSISDGKSVGVVEHWIGSGN